MMHYTVLGVPSPVALLRVRFRAACSHPQVQAIVVRLQTSLTGCPSTGCNSRDHGPCPATCHQYVLPDPGLPVKGSRHNDPDLQLNSHLGWYTYVRTYMLCTYQYGIHVPVPRSYVYLGTCARLSPPYCAQHAASWMLESCL
jgi:hypothetical protein